MSVELKPDSKLPTFFQLKQALEHVTITLKEVDLKFNIDNLPVILIDSDLDIVKIDNFISLEQLWEIIFEDLNKDK